VGKIRNRRTIERSKDAPPGEKTSFQRDREARGDGDSQATQKNEVIALRRRDAALISLREVRRGTARRCAEDAADADFATKRRKTEKQEKKIVAEGGRRRVTNERGDRVLIGARTGGGDVCRPPSGSTQQLMEGEKIFEAADRSPFSHKSNVHVNDSGNRLSKKQKSSKRRLSESKGKKEEEIISASEKTADATANREKKGQPDRKKKGVHHSD